MPPYSLKFDVHCSWAFDDNYEILSQYDVIIVVDVLLFSTHLDLSFSSGQRTSKDFYYEDSTIRLIDIEEMTDYLPSNLIHKLNQTEAFVIFGCLRNARAVATAARLLGKNILIMPVGDKFEGEVKPCSEDMLGAGAIISYLQQKTLSPESEGALAVYNSSKKYLHDVVLLSGKAKELISEGYELEIELACKFNKSKFVAMLDGNSVKSVEQVAPVVAANS